MGTVEQHFGVSLARSVRAFGALLDFIYLNINASRQAGFVFIVA